MLSNNLKINSMCNILITRNSFKLINKYHELCKHNNLFTAVYSTYCKDKLVYSARLAEGRLTTLYDKESTRICEIKDNKIINVLEWNNSEKKLIAKNN